VDDLLSPYCRPIVAERNMNTTINCWGPSNNASSTTVMAAHTLEELACRETLLAPGAKSSPPGRKIWTRIEMCTNEHRSEQMLTYKWVSVARNPS